MHKNTADSTETVAEPDASPAALSRRRFIGAAGAAAGGLAVGARPAPAAGPRPSIHGAHQPGIVGTQQRHAIFAAFDVLPPARGAGEPDHQHERGPASNHDAGTALQALLQEWSATAAALMAGRPAPSTKLRPPGARSDSGEADDLPAAGLTITFGYGPTFFKDRFGLADARPQSLRPLPRFKGDALNPLWCGGDLLLQICGDDYQVLSHAFRAFRGRAPGVAALKWTQEGFNSPLKSGEAPRNLFGFHDGTKNPRGRERDAAVWIRPGDGPAWHEGGSYLVFRKIRMLLPFWELSSAAVQDQTIGRQRHCGRPLSPMPADAHVHRARGSDLLRRGFNYDYGVALPPKDTRVKLGLRDEHGGYNGHDRYDAGMLFAAFTRDPDEQFVALQHRLAARDALNRFTKHTGSAIFAIPPGAPRGGWLGQQLFE